MLRTVHSLTVIGLCIAWLSAGGAAETQYVLTDLGAVYDGYVGGPSGWSTLYGQSWAADINERGEVVGTTTVEVSPGVFEYHPFFWSPTTGMQTIDTLGADDGRANAVNNHGQVVGHVGDKAFLWDKTTGVTQDLGHLVSNPDTTVGDVWASAAGINDAGQVVGQSSKFTGSDYENPVGSFLWDETNGLQDLAPHLPVTTWSEAVDINSTGQIIGQGWGTTPGGYLLTPKDGEDGYDYLNLGWLGAGDATRPATSPMGLNDAGQVVGDSLDKDDHHAKGKPFVWNPDTETMTDLQRNTDLGAWEIGEAGDINNAGTIVGMLSNVANEPVKFGDKFAGVIWDADANRWVRLQTVTAMGGFFDIEDAAAVNDHGQIVGRAVTSDPQTTTDYKSRAVLLSPVLPDSILTGGQAGGFVVDDAWASGTYAAAGLPGSATPLDKSVELFELTLTGSFATLKLDYTEAELAAAGLAEQDLRLYWLDTASGEWVLAGNEANWGKNPDAAFVLGAPTGNLGDWGVDPDGNTVWANIDHASTYSVLAVPAVPEPASLGLLTLAAAGALAARRRRQ